MVALAAPILSGGLSEPQFTWLKTRLSTSSDAEACRTCSVTKETLRYWKRSSTFQQVLKAVRTDQLAAFRLLGMSLAGLALDSLQLLLTSPRGSDRRAGLEAFRAIFRLGAPDAPLESENTVQTIFNILQVKGDVSQEALKLINPMAKALTAVKVYDAPPSE